jgi:hypothetical protein
VSCGISEAGTPPTGASFQPLAKPDIVIKSDRTIRSEAAARAERGPVVIGVDLDAGRTRDPHGRGGAAEKHIQDGQAGQGREGAK